jgi:hypothetical protein
MDVNASGRRDPPARRKSEPRSVFLFATENRTGDQHDAYSIAAWLRRADHDGSLAAFLKPVLTQSERAVAQVESWILGVLGSIQEPVFDHAANFTHVSWSAEKNCPIKVILGEVVPHSRGSP